jgi:hypothetical protein
MRSQKSINPGIAVRLIHERHLEFGNVDPERWAKNTKKVSESEGQPFRIRATHLQHCSRCLGTEGMAEGLSLA